MSAKNKFNHKHPAKFTRVAFGRIQFACDLGFAGAVVYTTVYTSDSKHVKIEKVYTSDPQMSKSKKLTLLTQTCQFRETLHF